MHEASAVAHGRPSLYMTALSLGLHMVWFQYGWRIVTVVSASALQVVAFMCTADAVPASLVASHRAHCMQPINSLKLHSTPHNQRCA